MSRTKIVCTLGPACESEKTLRAMLRAGMSVARLNFSHGDHAWHSATAARFRRCAEREGRSAGLMCDIQGPKVRVGTFDGEVTLSPGQRVQVLPGDGLGDGGRIYVDYPRLAEELEPGDPIHLNDGTVKLVVRSKDGGSLRCVVETGGRIGSRKGVNLPSRRMSASIPTEKDLDDLRLIARIDPEFVAVSFVGKAADLERVRRTLRGHGARRTRLVAKIERPSAVERIEKIVNASDAVMVARGDLGVEIPTEEVPRVQKEIISLCNDAGKPVIVATQMLESMRESPRPTRAEASDVFNAVLDGADAVMLSGETSAGLHPVEAVRTMRDIAESAEAWQAGRMPRPARWEANVGATVAASCGPLADALSRLGRKVSIVAVTASGYSARIVSRHRPPAPIIAMTPDARTARELSLSYGIDPMVGSDVKGGVEERALSAVRAAVRSGRVGRGDLVMAAMTSPKLGKGAMHLAVYEASQV